jgi:hypothetical protein
VGTDPFEGGGCRASTLTSQHRSSALTRFKLARYRFPSANASILPNY